MKLESRMNGEALELESSPVSKAGSVLVPLHSLCAAIGAEAKRGDGGPLAVCRDDLCIPLEGAAENLVEEIDGVLFARLDAFGEPLGLTWTLQGSVLEIGNEGASDVGLSVGDKPPSFSLPDLSTGEPVALEDYRGRRTVFYMWASW